MQGWGFPGASKKAHYFTDDGRSLCERWGFFRGDVEDDKHDHPDNCTMCQKRRLKLAAVKPTEETR